MSRPRHSQERSDEGSDPTVRDDDPGQIVHRCAPRDDDRTRPSHWSTHVVLALILAAGLALHLYNLGHPAVRDLDEAFHAIVARSMLDDPLRPTLYATPYLPYDYRSWQSNHIWLHKPPVALWQIAASFATFGESNVTLRLPSVLMAAGAAALTFLIGRALAGDAAGLVAAALQALSPALIRLVHGQVFSDHVDVALLFWCEAAVLLLIRAARSGRTADAALAGVAQAIAWLAKSHPAGFVALLALLLFAWPRVPGFRLSRRQLVAFVVAATIVAAPWPLWCLVQYPREFGYEQLHVLRHLTEDIETFAAPWDRLLADYLPRGLLEWYPLALVAVALVAVDGVRRRDPRRLLVGAWALAVLVPHLMATSKTPTATLTGWPAAWLAVGIVVADALRRRPFAVAAVVVAGVLLIVWPQRPGASALKLGTKLHFGAIALAHWPLAASALSIGVAGLVAVVVTERARSRPTPLAWRTPQPAAWGVALAVLIAYPAYRYARLAARTSADVPADAVAFPELGRFVRAKSPPNSVFFVDAQERGEAIVAMWWLDRTCYRLRDATLDDDVAAVIANGGEPFILSRRPRPERALPGVPGEARLYLPGPSAAPATRP